MMIIHDSDLKGDATHQHTWSHSDDFLSALIGLQLQRFIAEFGRGVLWQKAEKEIGMPTDIEQDSMVVVEGIGCFSWENQIFGYLCEESTRNYHRVVSDGPIDSFVNAVNAFIREASPFRGHLVQLAHGGSRYISNCLAPQFLSLPEMNMDDVVLDQTVKDDVFENTIVQLELNQNTGVLLYGPPGTGKTRTCKVLASEAIKRGYSALMIAGGVDFNDLGELIEGFMPRPLILFFEDLDTFAEDRMSGRESHLSQFLQFMDGMATRQNQIVVVGTTNHRDFLDDAIKKRPGRFSRHYEIGFPPQKSLRTMIEDRFGPQVIPDELVQACLKYPFTGAHIEEIYRTSLTKAHRKQCEPADCFVEALETVAQHFDCESQSLGLGHG
ncbi:MAG: AAA family ATPase [Opitutales bacterium]